MSICFFMGHRDVPDDLVLKLKEAIEHHIVYYGVREFVVGKYGKFDSMAAQAVRKAKESHKGIRLTLLLPYYNSTAAMPTGYDDSLYPEGMERVPKRVAIVQANRYMIEHSNYIIAYANGRIGNTRSLMEYAKKQESKGLLRIVNLGIRNN